MSSTDNPPTLTLALSDIMHHMSPSPAPTSDDLSGVLPLANTGGGTVQDVQGESDAHHEVDVFGIRRRLEELGYSVAASRNGFLAGQNARERELVDMVIRLTDSLPVDPAQLERQAGTIASLAAQRDFMIRQAEEERERWKSEKEGWERTAEALLTFRNKRGKSEDVDRLKASFEAENKALRDKLQEAQRRLSTLEAELLRLKPMLLMQPFPPSSSTSRQDKGKGREIDSSRTLGTIPEERETHGGGKTQYYFHNYQYPSSQPGRMITSSTSQQQQPPGTSHHHQRRRSRDLTATPSSSSKPLSQPQSKSQKQNPHAPPQPLTSDAYTEHILLAAKRIGRKRAAQVAGMAGMVEREREVLVKEQQERVRVVQTQREQGDREREREVNGGGYYRTGVDGLGSPQRAPRSTGPSSTSLPRTPKRNAAPGIHYSNLGTGTPGTSTHPLTSTATTVSTSHNAMQVDSPLVYVNVTPASKQNGSPWASGSGVMGTPGQLRSALGGRAGGASASGTTAGAGGGNTPAQKNAVLSNPPTPLASLLDAARMMDHEEQEHVEQVNRAASGSGGGGGGDVIGVGAKMRGRGKANGKGGRVMLDDPPESPPAPKRRRISGSASASASTSVAGKQGTLGGNTHNNNRSGAGNGGNTHLNRVRSALDVLADQAAAAVVDLDHPPLPLSPPSASGPASAATGAAKTSSSASTGAVKGKGKAKERAAAASKSQGPGGRRGAQRNEEEKEESASASVTSSRAGRVVRGSARGSSSASASAAASAAASASASAAATRVNATTTRDNATTTTTTTTTNTSSRPVRQAVSKRRVLSPDLADRDVKGRNTTRTRARTRGGAAAGAGNSAAAAAGKAGDASASMAGGTAAGGGQAQGHQAQAQGGPAPQPQPQPQPQPPPQPRVIAPAPGYSQPQPQPQPPHPIPHPYLNPNPSLSIVPPWNLEGRSPEKDRDEDGVLVRAANAGVGVGVTGQVQPTQPPEQQQLQPPAQPQQQRREEGEEEGEEQQQQRQPGQGQGQLRSLHRPEFEDTHRPVADQERPLQTSQTQEWPTPISEMGSRPERGDSGVAGDEAAYSHSNVDRTLVGSGSGSSRADVSSSAGTSGYHHQSQSQLQPQPQPQPQPQALPPAPSDVFLTQENDSHADGHYLDAESFPLAAAAAAAGAVNGPVQRGESQTPAPVVILQGSEQVDQGVPFPISAVAQPSPTVVVAAAAGAGGGGEEEDDDGLLDADAEAEPDPDLDVDAEGEEEEGGDEATSTQDQDQDQDQDHASRSKSPPPPDPPPPPGGSGSGGGSGGGSGNGGGGSGHGHGSGGHGAGGGGGGAGAGDAEHDADADADAEADPDPDAEGEMEYEEGESDITPSEVPEEHWPATDSDCRSRLRPWTHQGSSRRPPLNQDVSSALPMWSSMHRTSAEGSLFVQGLSSHSTINSSSSSGPTPSSPHRTSSPGLVLTDDVSSLSTINSSSLTDFVLQVQLSPCSPNKSTLEAVLSSREDGDDVDPEADPNPDAEGKMKGEEVEGGNVLSRSAADSDSRWSCAQQGSSRQPQPTEESPSSTSTLSSHSTAFGASFLTEGPSPSTIYSSSLPTPTLQIQLSPDSPNKSTLEAVLSSEVLSLSTKLGLSARSSQNSFSLSPANMISSSTSDSVPLLKFHTESSPDCLSIPFTQCMLSHDRHSLEEKFQEDPLSLSDPRLTQHESERHRSTRGFQRNILQLPMLENLPAFDKWSNDDVNLGQISRWKEFGFRSLSDLDIIWPPKLKEATCSWSSIYHDVNLSGPPFRTASTFVQPLVEAMA